MIKLELRKCKMENFDKNIIVLGLILVSTFYLFYRSLFNTKKLTTFQQHNRRQLINKQGVILAFIGGCTFPLRILKQFRSACCFAALEGGFSPLIGGFP